ncbi:MAG: tetratricopeptide repeat protein [Smithella sp.]
MKKAKIIRINFVFWVTLLAIGNIPCLVHAGNLYTIHCASYKSKQQAEVDVKNLGTLGYPAYVMQVDIKGKGKWYRVYTGKYATKEKARIAADMMVKKNVLTRYFIFSISANRAVEKKGKNIKQENLPTVQIEQKRNSGLPATKKDTVAAKVKATEETRQAPSALLSEKKTVPVKDHEQIFAEKEEPSSGSVLYDQGLRELKEKKYEQALVTFKEFVARKDTTNDLGERALRHMADCHFFLGEKGSKDHLLLAVQFYKNTLQSFPDQVRDNALVYLRLAKACERLNNYYDTLRYYEDLLSKYPQSSCVPEAFFKTGALLHKIGKYGPAADKLLAYLMKYRGGTFAKQAFYLVADCYYKTQQSASAEVWFRDAQKKWPDFRGVPKEVIKDMGYHKYALQSYGEASKILSFYANIYPTDEKIKEVLLALANSYKAADQVSAALTINSLIIDKYPASKEAAESIMAMASLGVDKPGVKMFFAAGNFHYYKDPLEAYKLLLAKNQTGEIAENALLQKGNALHKLKQDRAAADAYLEFLKKYPQSKMRDEARKSLKHASVTLIDESYRKKDYLAVSDIYFRAYRGAPLQRDEYETVDKIAVSLNNVGLTDDCVQLLRKYKNICEDGKTVSKINNRIAETEMGRGKYNEAEKVLSESLLQTLPKNKTALAAIKKDMAGITDRKRLSEAALSQSAGPDNRYWSMFRMGQDYIDKGNYSEAQKIFAKIKAESGPEGFWTKIVDYHLSDQQWWNKYGEYLKK